MRLPGTSLANQYTVWYSDSSGNCVSNAVGVVPGTSTALKSLEPSFHQDLNGDGVVGLRTSPIAGLALSESSTLDHAMRDDSTGLRSKQHSSPRSVHGWVFSSEEGLFGRPLHFKSRYRGSDPTRATCFIHHVNFSRVAFCCKIWRPFPKGQLEAAIELVLLVGNAAAAFRYAISIQK